MEPRRIIDFKKEKRKKKNVREIIGKLFIILYTMNDRSVNTLTDKSTRPLLFERVISNSPGRVIFRRNDFTRLYPRKCAGASFEK